MVFDYNTFVLIGNFLIYLIWFLISFIKDKKITAYSFLILWIAIIAFIGIWSYSFGLYSKTYLSTGFMNIKNMDILGFLFVFTSFYILLYPLKFLKFRNVGRKYVYTTYYRHFENFSFIFSILLSVLLLPYTIVASAIDAVEVYTSGREDGVRLLPVNMERAVTLFKLLYLFFLPFCFYRIKKNIHRKYVIFLIVMFVNVIQISVLSASRGTLFVSLASFIFMYFIFSGFYRKIVKKTLVFWISVLLAVSIFLGIGITISRTKDAQISLIENIVLYFGESFIHFGLQIWDNDKLVRTNGLIYFPTVYESFTGVGTKKFNSHQDRVDYWAFKANSGNHNNFAPIYGKLYMEFGPFIPFLILFIFSFVLTRLFQRYKVSTLIFPLLTYLFANIFFYSVFSNPLRDDIVKDLIYMGVFMLFLKLMIKRNQPILT